MDYRQDIPIEIARAAHAGTSFVPEDRARQERDSYAATLAGDYERLAKLATTPEKRVALAAEFERYRSGYRARYLAHLSARSRCVSTMIAGPSKFPAERMRKRGAAADKRAVDLTEYRERALAAIRKVLTPELAPIMTGDHDAAERLEGKLAKAERLQESMRRINAAIRQHAKAGPDAQLAAMVAPGVTEPRARNLLEPDFMGRIGFADYQLRNNGAEIRRLRARLATVQAAKATPETEIEGRCARVEDCPADNRVRLFFPGKPEADVRARLKRSGFRWAPSIGAWQAYRNPVTITIALAVAGGG